MKLRAVLFLLTLGWQSTSYAQLSVNISFSEREATIIHSYYENQTSQSRGRGGGGGKGLPPGIARNLERGKALPPGIAKQQLPSGLTEALPPPPDGYERSIIDGKILLIEIATQVIHDVLTDALFR